MFFLPQDYEVSGKKYPVFYHLHGWMGNESSEISTLSFLCGSRQTITVFPNSSPLIEDYENLPAEEMLITELIPLIDKQYRTDGERRRISGFSMGGAMAFYCAAKYPHLFSSVTDMREHTTIIFTPITSPWGNLWTEPWKYLKVW